MSPFDKSKNETLTLCPEKISSTNHCFLGECIGTESCLDLKENLTFDDDVTVCRKPVPRRRKTAEVRDYPPPIPLLARTGNQSSHMPWVLKREYTKDGRLVLIEEKVKHHEYFKTERCDGHLTLQLIHLDDIGLFPPFINNHDNSEEEEENGTGDIINGAENDGEDQQITPME
ncbi:hypothetical protein ACFE04_025722 [Oxalis oulophora]